MDICLNLDDLKGGQGVGGRFDTPSLPWNEPQTQRTDSNCTQETQNWLVAPKQASMLGWDDFKMPNLLVALKQTSTLGWDDFKMLNWLVVLKQASTLD